MSLRNLQNVQRDLAKVSITVRVQDKAGVKVKVRYSSENLQNCACAISKLSAMCESALRRLTNRA